MANQTLLTCHHIRLACSNNFDNLVAANLSKTPLAGAKVLVEDSNLDFSILKCPNLNSNKALKVSVTPDEYLGEICFLIGNPACNTFGRPEVPIGDGLVISFGRIESIGDSFLDVYAPTINPGYSGGMVLTQSGACIAMISEQYGHGGRCILMKNILERILEL